MTEINKQLATEDPLIEALIEEFKNRDDIANLWLYGSRATGHAQQNSDYDLAVEYRDYSTSAYQRRIRPELLAMDLQQKYQQDISIIDIVDCPLALAVNVIDEGIALIIKDELAYCRTLNRISGLWSDQQWQIQEPAP